MIPLDLPVKSTVTHSTFHFLFVGMNRVLFDPVSNPNHNGIVNNPFFYLLSPN